jgi:hypothetical protein
MKGIKSSGYSRASKEDFYLSRIASEMNVRAHSFPSDADSKGLKPRGLSRNGPEKHMCFSGPGPGLALGFDTFHATECRRSWRLRWHMVKSAQCVLSQKNGATFGPRRSVSGEG